MTVQFLLADLIFVAVDTGDSATPHQVIGTILQVVALAIPVAAFAVFAPRRVRRRPPSVSTTERLAACRRDHS